MRNLDADMPPSLQLIDCCQSIRNDYRFPVIIDRKVGKAPIENFIYFHIGIIIRNQLYVAQVALANTEHVTQ